MTALIITLIIVVLVLFIAVSRVGIIVEYSGEGIKVWLKAGFARIRLFQPEKDKNKKQNRQEEHGEEKDGGSFEQLKNTLPIINEILGKLKQRLTIDRFTVRYLSACEDPAMAALAFGAASAGAGILLPILETNFTIKNRDIKTNVSFTEKKSSIYIHAQATISVFHLQGALLILKSLKTNKNNEIKKLEEK